MSIVLIPTADHASEKAVIAHELRTALTVARGYTELLVRALHIEHTEPDELRRLSGQVLTNLARIDAVIAERLAP